MTELVTFGETSLRLSPPGKERLESASDVHLYADGQESNVAVAANCLGTDSLWLSKLPDIPPARHIVSELQGHGVDTDITWSDEGRLGILYHEAPADPRDLGLWHDRDNTATSTIDPGELPMDLIQSAEVVFAGASTASLSEDAAKTTEAILRAGSGAGATAALDLDYQPGLHDADLMREVVQRLFEHVDVFFANEENARNVLGMTGQPRELANMIVAEYGLEMAVITRSERGAAVMHDTPGTNVIHERDTVESAEVDPTGQHAAFVGGFLQRLSEDADAAEALTYAVATAALARTIPGPYLIADDDEITEVADQVRKQS